jgi:hypothetical protein
MLMHFFSLSRSSCLFFLFGSIQKKTPISKLANFITNRQTLKDDNDIWAYPARYKGSSPFLLPFSLRPAADLSSLIGRLSPN